MIFPSAFKNVSITYNPSEVARIDASMIINTYMYGYQAYYDETSWLIKFCLVLHWKTGQQACNHLQISPSFIANNSIHLLGVKFLNCSVLPLKIFINNV